MSDIHTEEEIADTYLRHFELRQAQDFWAFEEVHGFFERGDREAAWRMTRLLIKKLLPMKPLPMLQLVHWRIFFMVLV